jgi:hypothetical protein
VESKIEQEQFVRLVAGRLGVPEDAVRAELSKIKTGTHDAASPDVHEKSAELSMAPLERKVGMLLFGWSGGKDKLRELLGAEHLSELEAKLAPRAEDLRFRFDQEVGEHTNEDTIARDLLDGIAKAVEKERFKMKFL